ncbi:hypothetical protein ABT187_06995 [Streptomyces sp. NPDC001817]|uniref:hypothetical protein n=1 Tax=Streptomyces sp. NPDC001817 TaxID=3154398 RepID=UPI0033258A77
MRVPAGVDAERWVTRAGCRRVLFVVHNVTSATRLLDVLPLLHGDLRVQSFATCTGSSPFLAGVPELCWRRQAFRYCPGNRPGTSSSTW